MQYSIVWYTHNDIIVHDYVEFSNIATGNLIRGGAHFSIKIMEHTHINVAKNTLQSYMFLVQDFHILTLLFFSSTKSTIEQRKMKLHWLQ